MTPALGRKPRPAASIPWAGEFGRTPMSQAGTGRDGHNKGFSICLAGGGIKPGMTRRETDEPGYAAVSDIVNVHDLHAAMLHLLGIEHTRVTTNSGASTPSSPGSKGQRLVGRF